MVDQQDHWGYYYCVRCGDYFEFDCQDSGECQGVVLGVVFRMDNNIFVL